MTQGRSVLALTLHSQAGAWQGSQSLGVPVVMFLVRLDPGTTGFDSVSPALEADTLATRPLSTACLFVGWLVA